MSPITTRLLLSYLLYFHVNQSNQSNVKEQLEITSARRGLDVGHLDNFYSYHPNSSLRGSIFSRQFLKIKKIILKNEAQLFLRKN